MAHTATSTHAPVIDWRWYHERAIPQSGPWPDTDFKILGREDFERHRGRAETCPNCLASRQSMRTWKNKMTWKAIWVHIGLLLLIAGLVAGWGLY